jgi:hypothetical protein
MWGDDLMTAETSEALGDNPSDAGIPADKYSFNLNLGEPNEVIASTSTNYSVSGTLILQYGGSSNGTVVVRIGGNYIDVPVGSSTYTVNPGDFLQTNVGFPGVLDVDVTFVPS